MGRHPIQLQKKIELSTKVCPGTKVSVVKAKVTKVKSRHLPAGKNLRDASDEAAPRKTGKIDTVTVSKKTDAKGKKTAKGEVLIEPPVERGDIFRVQTTRDSSWYVPSCVCVVVFYFHLINVTYI